MTGGMLLMLVFVLFLSSKAHALTPEDAAAVSGQGWHSLPSGKYRYMIILPCIYVGDVRVIDSSPPARHLYLQALKGRLPTPCFSPVQKTSLV